MPWIEDQYLYYFGKDNKASYATKGDTHDPFGTENTPTHIYN